MYSILVANMEGAGAFVHQLREEGFAAAVYEGGISEDHSAAASRGIWLGSEIPVEVAVTIIRMAWTRYPFLSFVHLSGDSGEPEELDKQIFIGGSTK